jgi:hypothetical protein
MGGVHNGIEHIGGTHFDGKSAKEENNNRQTNDATKAVAGSLQGTEVPFCERHVHSTHSHDLSHSF